MKIKDKRVVVTGAASGIGLALCEEFYKSGAKSIVCVDMNEDGAKEIAKKVNGIAVAADVSIEQDIINVIEKSNECSDLNKSLVHTNYQGDFVYIEEFLFIYLIMKLVVASKHDQSSP